MRIRWRRRAAGLLVVGATLGAVALGSLPVAADTDTDTDRSSVEPVSLEGRHLPRVVNAPGTWSTRYGVHDPVAVVGIATRTRPVELFEGRESMTLFAVSAIDSSASWLRLPGFSLDRWGYSSGVAVSPDGQWIGWVRPARSRGRGLSMPVAGWSVMNTTTGDVHDLDVPGHSSVRGTMGDLAFSGDSRYLLTSYETPDHPKPKPNAPRSGVHQLVAWDVEDGAPTVIEEPGPYWLPQLGSAPTGVVWARDRQVFRVDPRTGERTTLTLPQDVIGATWSPDDTSFAYLGRASSEGKPKAPWRLYAGRTVAEARGQAFDLPGDVEPGQLLGWRDATHVVVGHWRDSVHVVDIGTGDVEEIDLAGYGEQLNTPQLAAALWQQPLVVPPGPQGTTDPRRPWQGITLGLLAALVGALVLRRRWNTARRSEQRARRPDERADDPALGRVRPWRSLSTVATGLLVVFVDIRFNGVDVIPDPVGWIIAAVALSLLRDVHRGFSVAGLAAWVAVIPALAEWFNVDHPLIVPALSVVLLVVEIAVCTALIGAGSAWAASASTIRWLDLVLGVSLVLALVLVRAVPSAGVLAFAVGLANFVVSLWFLVLLYGAAREPSSRAPQPVRV